MVHSLGEMGHDQIQYWAVFCAAKMGPSANQDPPQRHQLAPKIEGGVGSCMQTSSAPIIPRDIDVARGKKARGDVELPYKRRPISHPHCIVLGE